MSQRRTIPLALDLPADALEQLADLIADRISERTATATDRPRWMTTTEAADYLRTSPDALHRKTAADAIPHVKEGGRLLFDREELDGWLAQHRAGPLPAVSSPFPRRRKAA